VSLDLGISKAVQLPTDERLLAFAKAATRNWPPLLSVWPLFADFKLAPGRQPANLQGLWNYHMERLGSKYTININTR